MCKETAHEFVFILKADLLGPHINIGCIHDPNIHTAISQFIAMSGLFLGLSTYFQPNASFLFSFLPIVGLCDVIENADPSR